MPGDVMQFLKNVHAEKDTTTSTSMKTKEEFLFDGNNVDGSQNDEIFSIKHKERDQRTLEDRKRLEDYKMHLPVGQRSEKWFLVTNDNVEQLLKDSSSFVYGQNPSKENVPIYAMVNMCHSSKFGKHGKFNGAHFKDKLKKVNLNKHADIPYIPVMILADNSSAIPYSYKKNPISTPKPLTNKSTNAIQNLRKKRNSERPLNLHTSSNVTNPKETHEFRKYPMNFQINKYSGDLPHFHVTYWMFYPYSQGKTICTVSLGPLGRLPIPMLFGMCLGSRRDFGSHIGDWEHMSLSFKGRAEPEEMYVSAHDAGAYYTYERLTGTFDFRSQETRKGILQQPNFPKTVLTSSNHPVMFSAQGSHGLWTAPGKHRFVRLPRLFDINGFGTPWLTWKQVNIAYDRSGKTVKPEWLLYNGRWGNPKNKCHPLKRIGLNFCEYSDGPTGIPLKKPHFFCEK